MDVGRSQTDVCVYTSRAYERLRSGRPGDSITRDKMATVVGRPVEPGCQGYGNVQSAIRKCEHEERIVWEWRRDRQVWLCLDDGQQRDSIMRRQKRHRRSLSRTARRIDIVDADKLNPEDRVSLQTTAIQVSLAQRVLSKKMERRIESAELETLRLPDVDALASALKGGG